MVNMCTKTVEDEHNDLASLILRCETQIDLHSYDSTTLSNPQHVLQLTDWKQ